MGLLLDGAVPCGAGGLSCLVGNCGAIMAIKSLATSNVSRMEGSSCSSTWHSLAGGSSGTRLDGSLCRPKVDSADPCVGCIPLMLSDSVL